MPFALTVLLLPLTLAAAEPAPLLPPPAVLPLPPSVDLSPVERLRAETRRREIDRRIRQEQLRQPRDAAGLRTLETLRANRQRLDRMLQK